MGHRDVRVTRVRLARLGVEDYRDWLGSLEISVPWVTEVTQARQGGRAPQVARVPLAPQVIPVLPDPQGILVQLV